MEVFEVGARADLPYLSLLQDAHTLIDAERRNKLGRERSERQKRERERGGETLRLCEGRVMEEETRGALVNERNND